MRASLHLLAVVILLALPSAAMARRGRPEPIPCPADVTAALATACPCDAAENHGQHLRCVVRFRHLLRRSGCLTEATRGVVSCAARSTCGRPAAVVCCMPARATIRARVTWDEARCTALGGTVFGVGSVCGACVAVTTSTSTSSSSSSITSSTATTTTSTSTSTTVAVGGVYGNAAEYPTGSTHTPDHLLGGPVMVAAPSTLTHLAVIAKSAGPNVVLALYSSNAMGEPNQLMASAPTTPLAVGAVEVPVTPTALPAGQYWLFGVYDVEASVGIDESDLTAPVRYVSHPFAAAPPALFGPAAAYAGQRFNYYLKVQ